MADTVIPPLPDGATLDPQPSVGAGIPPLPEGATLDASPDLSPRAVPPSGSPDAPTYSSFYGDGAPPPGVTPTQVAVDKSMLGRVLDAFGQGARAGWGDERLGLSEDSLRWLKEHDALVPIEDAWQHPLKAFNEMLLQSGAVAFDAIMRVPSAVVGSLATGGAQVLTETGAPQVIERAAGVAPAGQVDPQAVAQEANTIAVLAGAETPMARISKAKALGVTDSEAAYLGTKPVERVPEAVPEMKAAEAVRPVEAVPEAAPRPAEPEAKAEVKITSRAEAAVTQQLESEKGRLQQLYGEAATKALSDAIGSRFVPATIKQRLEEVRQSLSAANDDASKTAAVEAFGAAIELAHGNGVRLPNDVLAAYDHIASPSVSLEATYEIHAKRNQLEQRYKDAFAGYLAEDVGTGTLRSWVHAAENSVEGWERSPVDLAAMKDALDIKERAPIVTPEAEPSPPAPSKVEVPVQPTQSLADPLPPGVKQTKLNLNYDAPQDIVDFIKQQAVEAGDFAAERRSGTSWAETERLGQALGLDAAAVLKRQVGEINGASWMDAATNVLIQSTRDVKEAWQKAAVGSDAEKLAALQAEAQHSMLMASVMGNEAEIGRALNILRKFKQTTAEARDVARIIDEEGGLEAIRERAARGATLDTPEQVSGFIRDTMKPRLGKMLQELWVNWLLSGPVTQAKNIAGNMTTALWRTTESGVAAGIGLLHGGEKVALGEPFQRLYAVVHSSPEMIKAGWRAWKEDDASGGKLVTSFQQIPSATITVAGHKFQVGGKQIRIPGRALAATDAMFKTLAYRQSIAAQAWRRAAKAGLKGDAFTRELARLNQSPTAKMMENAVRESELQTLTQPLGPTGRAIQNIANHNLLTKMIAPFVKFGINALKFAGERSVLSVLHPEIREILAGKKGAAARDEQIAKIVVGSAVSTTAIYMASQGMVTGQGPADPAERALLRATGWQPYSFKIGGVYHAGNWDDPASTIFFVAADMYEVGSKLSETDAKTVAELLMGSVINNVTSKTYMQGLSDAVDLMNDPGRYGERWINKQAGTIVPTGLAQVARLQDPYLRDARTILDTLRSRLPKTPLNPEFNSESVFPRRDVWGNAIKREGAAGPDIISPIYTSREKNDPVANELLALGVYPAALDRQIRGVDLTPKQFDDYQRVAGKVMRFRLEQLFNTPEWSGITPGIRAQMADKIINGSREMARKVILMAYPEIMDQAAQQKIDLLTGASLPK